MRALNGISVLSLLVVGCDGSGVLLGLGDQCTNADGALPCGEPCAESGAVCRIETGSARAICQQGSWQCANAPSNGGSNSGTGGASRSFDETGTAVRSSGGVGSLAAGGIGSLATGTGGRVGLSASTVSGGTTPAQMTGGNTSTLTQPTTGGLPSSSERVNRNSVSWSGAVFLGTGGALATAPASATGGASATATSAATGGSAATATSSVTGTSPTSGGCRVPPSPVVSDGCTLFLGGPPLPGFPGSLAGVAIGDLNCDGRADIAATMPGSRAVGVVLGRGDGTFGAHSAYPAAEYPGQLRIADLDGDGDNDIVIANVQDNTLSVFLNFGDGTLSPRTDYPTGAIEWMDTQVAVGDVNGDGKADLATPGAGAVSLLLGKGDGTFGAKTDYAVKTNDMSLAFGDLNQDGRDDLAVSGDATSILFGQSDGTLSRPVEYPEPSYYVAVGDLNRDGMLDVATGSEGALLNRGNGAFEILPETGNSDVDFIAALGDVDGDGILDLAMLTGDEDGDLGFIRIIRGRGDGTFEEEVWYPSPAFLEALAIGELNGDGKNDILVNSGPWMLFSPDFGLNQYGGEDSGIWTHLNGDRVLDFVTVLRDEDYDTSVAVLLGRSDGSYAASVSGTTDGDVSYLGLGDANGDGIADLVTFNSSHRSMFVLVGAADGTFPTSIESAIGSSPSVAWTYGDFNGDRLLDFAATGIVPDNAVGVSFANADGTYSPPVAVSPADWVWNMAAGDLNGDGHTDLVFSNRMQIGVVLGKGGGAFAERLDIPTSDYAEELALADLNHDGVLDLATVVSVDVVIDNTNSADDYVEVALGLGNGDFGPWRRINTPLWQVENLTVGDLNADGQPDLIAQQYYDFHVFFNDGAGNFDAGPTFPGWIGPAENLVDYNHDGRLDLVNVLSENGAIRFNVRLNQCK
ncbi:MAG: FG-GAP repeat domain-containing protein [Myxococcales bacterium]